MNLDSTGVEKIAENQRVGVSPKRLAEIQQDIQYLEMLLASRGNRYKLGLQRRISALQNEIGVDNE